MFDKLPAHRDVEHPVCTKCSGMIRFKDRQALEMHLNACRGLAELPIEQPKSLAKLPIEHPKKQKGIRTGKGKQRQPSIPQPRNVNQRQSEPTHQQFLNTTSITPSGHQMSAEDYVDGSWSPSSPAQDVHTSVAISPSFTSQEGSSAAEAIIPLTFPKEAQHLKHDSLVSESGPNGSEFTDEQQLLTLAERQLEQLSLQPASTPKARNSYTYHCGDCDLDFSVLGKLRRHKAEVHRQQPWEVRGRKIRRGGSQYPASWFKGYVGA